MDAAELEAHLNAAHTRLERATNPDERMEALTEIRRHYEGAAVIVNNLAAANPKMQLLQQLNEGRRPGLQKL